MCQQGMHRRKLSSWQYAHLNLSNIVNNKYRACKTCVSHAIHTFAEHINKFLILLSPSSHGVVGLNETADVMLDVLLLTTFMKRHTIKPLDYCARNLTDSMGLSRGYSSSIIDVVLEPTSNTDEWVGMVQPDRVPDEIQDLFASRWRSYVREEKRRGGKRK
jgi:hypothetical protein